MELDVGGGFDDDLDRLLPVKAAHVALTLEHAGVAVAFAGDGGFEGEVVGPHHVDARHAVVVHLPTKE